LRPGPRYPSLYQINTRVWLTELSKNLGRAARGSDIRAGRAPGGGDHYVPVAGPSLWQGPDEKQLLVAVNYAPNQSQCFVRLPFTDLDGRQWRLEDRMQETVYDRDGCDLQRRGLYLDVRPRQASVFTLTQNPSGS
jgi:hypothetical protein